MGGIFCKHVGDTNSCILLVGNPGETKGKTVLRLATSTAKGKLKGRLTLWDELGS